MNRNGDAYLKKLVRIIMREQAYIDKNEVQCCGVSLPQLYALASINDIKEVSLNELAEVSNVDKSTMSRTVENLVSKELAVREEHPEDRRYTVIRLTKNGCSVANLYEESMDSYYKKIFDSIPEEKKEQVLESLELLIAAVDKNKCC